jgi:ribosomal protein S27AE
MNIQVACPVLCAAQLSRPNCPQCGSVLLVAEHSAFNPDGHIRHSWLCDACGEEFTTSVRVLPRQAR